MVPDAVGLQPPQQVGQVALPGLDRIMLRGRRLHHARDVRRRQPVLGAQGLGDLHRIHVHPDAPVRALRQQPQTGAQHQLEGAQPPARPRPRPQARHHRVPCPAPAPAQLHRQVHRLAQQIGGRDLRHLRAHRQPPLEEPRHPLGQGEPLRQQHVRPQRALHPKDALRLEEVRVAVHHAPVPRFDPRLPNPSARHFNAM